MKLGIYGGTFNPIHLGHVHILRELIARLALDRALLIPTKEPPHKQAPDLAPEEDRLAMCALAAGEIEEAPVEVSRLEMDRPGKSYTALTVQELQKLYPEDELYLLMGEDMFLTVDTWYHPELIIQGAALCVTPRSPDGLSKLQAKKRELEKNFGAVCFVENVPWLPISSTQIRRMAEKGESVGELVPRDVAAYLNKHRLYGGNGK